jgi:manganese transport protein
MTHRARIVRIGSEHRAEVGVAGEQADRPPDPRGGLTSEQMMFEAVAAGQTPLQRLRERGLLRSTVTLMGPAFVAALAYVDPGNFGTNFAGGASEGYRLVWVIVAANLTAMFVQALSAKLGVATGRSLPELCREEYPRPVVVGLWAQAELVAMATDVAEVIGGAIALNLLFGMPLLLGGLVTGAVAFALLALHGSGYRRFEVVSAGLLAVTMAGITYDVVRAGFDGGAILQGFVPRLNGSAGLLIATGIIGATVMPHVIYLHSALTGGRIPVSGYRERRTILVFQWIDVTVALGLAGIVNLAMLVVGARLFQGQPSAVRTLPDVHASLQTSVGAGAAVAFAVALLASGFASSGVGTLAGQVVMQGFLRRRVPVLLRRLVTLVPALVVIAVGLDPTRALVLSQVVLSFGIPFALVPLVLLSRRRDVMGELANNPRTSALAWAVAVAVIALNVYLLATTF